MPADWVDMHAGAVQAGSSIVIAILTVALVWVTHRYANVVKQQRFDLSRPVIHPSGAPPLMESRDVDWNQLDCELVLRNVGSGVALVVCGVLFPPRTRTTWKHVTRTVHHLERIVFSPGLRRPVR